MSKSSKGKILRAVKNFNEPFITPLSQKQIPDNYFEYNSVYMRKRKACRVRTIKSTNGMHKEWCNWLFVIGFSYETVPRLLSFNFNFIFPTFSRLFSRLLSDFSRIFPTFFRFFPDFFTDVSRDNFILISDVHFPILFTWGC